MTFVVSGKITIDEDGAVAKVERLDRAIEKTGKSTGVFSGQGRKAAGDTKAFAAEVDIAQHNVSNLGFQVNDVLAGIIGGQSPFVIGAQQGTQFNQVFGNAGATGRMMMLKQAVTSVLNPVSLMTIGIIAGTAALAQFGLGALSAEEDLDGLEDKLEAVAEKQRSLSEEVRRSVLGVSSEELTLIDQIADARGAVAEAEERAQRARGQTKRGAQDQLQAERENLAELQAQLDELIAIQSARDRLISGARETADAERTVGQNVGQTVQEIEEAEAMAEMLRDGIKATVIEAMMLAGVDITAPISSAAEEAARLASNLGIAYEQAIAIQQQRAALEYQRSNERYSGRGGDPRQFDSENRFGGQFIPSADVVAQADKILRPARSTSGRQSRGGSGTSEIEREREAVQDLIRTLTEQRDIIREIDPVQKEMIRNRETLKAATDAEKQSVEQLIASRIAEEAAIETATENAQTFKDVSFDALEGFALRGKTGADVIDNLTDSLAQAALQATFLGKGPLAGLFGTSESGGILGTIATALFPTAAPGAADGGIQYGPGGPRDDKLPRWLSPGEFVVNAGATAQNRALLEYINNGGLMPTQGMATGGAVAGMPASVPVAGRAGADGRVVIQIAPSAEFDARVLETSQNVSVEVLDNYRAQVLPRDVTKISNDPQVIG